jgi:hypothetical protein
VACLFIKAGVRALNRDPCSLTLRRRSAGQSCPRCSTGQVPYEVIGFAGGEEERYFAPLNDAQGGGLAGDQNSRDGGVVPKHKVPGEIVPRVDFPRWFPGEFLRRLVGRW